MITEDAVLSLNQFAVPKIVKDRDMINLKLIRLILYEPGTSPDQPDKGVGLKSRFRYIKGNELDQLKEETKRQIEMWLPQYSAVSIDYSITNKGVLNIGIQVDDTLYEYTYNGNELKNRTIEDIRSNQYGEDGVLR